MSLLNLDNLLLATKSVLALSGGPECLDGYPRKKSVNLTKCEVNKLLMKCYEFFPLYTPSHEVFSVLSKCRLKLPLS